MLTLLLSYLLSFQSNTRATDLSSSMDGAYHALLIGINNYQNFKDLKTPINDIEKLGEVLSTRYGFKVTYLKNEAATERGIENALHNIQLDRKDSLLIYFAGHGEEGTITSGSWIPQDAIKNESNTYYPNAKIIDFAENAFAQHVLVISDSCFAGSFFKKTRPVNQDIDIMSAFSLPSRWVIASGNLTTVDDQRGGKGRHSPFAFHLLKILKANRNPYLTPRGITLDLMQAVQKDSSNQQMPRAAALRDAGHEEGGSFIFWDRHLRDAEGNPYPPPWKTKQQDLLSADLQLLVGRAITLENGGDPKLCELLEQMGMEVTCNLDTQRRQRREVTCFCSEIKHASIAALRDYLELSHYQLKTHQDNFKKADDQECGEAYEIVIRN